MADENTVRSYRSNDTQRREAAPSAPAGTSKSGDPLADLARLIGQTDPFGDFGQRTPRSNERVASAPSTAGDWRKAAAAMPPYEVEPPPRPVLEPRTSMANPSQANPSQSNPGYGRHDPYQMAAHQAPTADARTTGFSDVRGETSATYYEQDHGHEGSADPVYVGASESRDAEPYFDDGAQLMPQDEQSYDDVPRARRRSGLFTAVTLIACAMVGTAGAYGYRTLYTGTSAAKVPPVIPAESTPNKIVPSNDSAANKSIQDRVGDASGPERIMPGAEQPVDLRGSALSNPRVVLPPPVAPLTNQTSPAPGGEPKKVRTVTIRPDGTDVSGRPVSGTQPAGQNNARTPSVARPPAPVTPPPVRGNGGPISLDPQAPGSPPAAAPAARERSAAALPLTPPAPRAPADGPPLAATQPSTGGGSYLVQLSSQKTEAEAHASFRSMQARYPSQLGGRSAVVKRADLGAKGTFYRAMVGPFGSSSEADQFCSSLKAAGGQCLIQRN